MRPKPLLPVLAALCIFITSCAQQPKIADPTNPQTLALWQQHETRMLAIDGWQLRGKLGVRAPDNNGSGQLAWQQQGEQFDIRLRGPLGQGAVNITGTPENVTLDIANHEQIKTSKPERALQQQVGWSLPVTSLQYWVRGLPDPDSRPVRELNERGQLQTLQQNGWHLEFRSYQQVGDTWLPRKIRLERDPVRLTLVVTQWRLDTAITQPNE